MIVFVQSSKKVMFVNYHVIVEDEIWNLTNVELCKNHVVDTSI